MSENKPKQSVPKSTMEWCDMSQEEYDVLCSLGEDAESDDERQSLEEIAREMTGGKKEINVEGIIVPVSSILGRQTLGQAVELHHVTEKTLPPVYDAYNNGRRA